MRNWVRSPMLISRASGYRFLRLPWFAERGNITGGWITRSMFKRYAIGSASDQRKVVELLEAERAKTKAAVTVGESDKPSVSLFGRKNEAEAESRID